MAYQKANNQMAYQNPNPTTTTMQSVGNYMPTIMTSLNSNFSTYSLNPNPTLIPITSAVSHSHQYSPTQKLFEPTRPQEVIF